MPIFLPATISEMDRLGWHRLDIVLVSGDAYIDSPQSGISLIGKALLREGFRVGIIAQPDIHSPDDIRRLGEPELFWGVTAGSVDSMVANYTASRKRRQRDDATPGGINNRRPDRATIVYTNLIRRAFKSTRPIVLGGIEASLRRIAHYDAWDRSIRRSVLFDAKADVLVYGMGERTVVELANAYAASGDIRRIRGICTISVAKPEGFLELPSYESVRESPARFRDMFRRFSENQDPMSASGLVQAHGGRFLVHNPPSAPLSTTEQDAIHALGFAYDVHPLHRSQGIVRALDTLDFSITTHRGCFGQCSFCAITLHQGRTVVSRSSDSVLDEIESMSHHPRFKGMLRDVGGPTANMYGMDCRIARKQGTCNHQACLFPAPCRQHVPDHGPLLVLLEKIRSLPQVRKAHIASGIRHDLVLSDRKNGLAFLKDLIGYHLSGQLKVAPEHTEADVLRWMHKPDFDRLITFKQHFDAINRAVGKKQFLTYYFMAAHPGCTLDHMKAMKRKIDRYLKLVPEQIQIFTPTPSTCSTMMYHTGEDPDTTEALFVERDEGQRMQQKRVIL